MDFAPFNRLVVGFDELFDQLARSYASSTSETNYPPYNIIKFGQHEYAVEFAVAGFDIDEIEIQLEGNTLTIIGEKAKKEAETQYLYKGISARSFRRTLPLGEHIEVRDAVIKNGMLTIKLERVVPESMKPRKIAITSSK